MLTVNQLLPAHIFEDLGIEVSASERADLLDHLNTTVEERVGTEIIDALTDEQLEIFLLMIEDDSPNLTSWLRREVPELETIVSDEIDIILGELADAKDQI